MGILSVFVRFIIEILIKNHMYSAFLGKPANQLAPDGYNKQKRKSYVFMLLKRMFVFVWGTSLELNPTEATSCWLTKLPS